MFPLQSVLFPTMVLPLHVFEPRYRALARQVTEGGGRFGDGFAIHIFIPAGNGEEGIRLRQGIQRHGPFDFPLVGQEQGDPGQGCGRSKGRSKEVGFNRQL